MRLIESSEVEGGKRIMLKIVNKLLSKQLILIKAIGKIRRMAANNGSDENDFVNIIISLSLVSLSLVTRLEPPNPIRFNLILSVPIHCIHCIHCSILNLSISDFSGFWKSTHDHHRNCKCIKLKIIIF